MEGTINVNNVEGKAIFDKADFYEVRMNKVSGDGLGITAGKYIFESGRIPQGMVLHSLYMVMKVKKFPQDAYPKVFDRMMLIRNYIIKWKNTKVINCTGVLLPFIDIDDLQNLKKTAKLPEFKVVSDCKLRLPIMVTHNESCIDISEGDLEIYLALNAELSQTNFKSVFPNKIFPKNNGKIQEVNIIGRFLNSGLELPTNKFSPFPTKFLKMHKTFTYHCELKSSENVAEQTLFMPIDTDFIVNELFILNGTAKIYSIEFFRNNVKLLMIDSIRTDISTDDYMPIESCSVNYHKVILCTKSTSNSGIRLKSGENLVLKITLERNQTIQLFPELYVVLSGIYPA